MDRTGIIVISICVLLMGWWLYEQEKYAQQLAQHPPAPVQTSNNPAPAAATSPAPAITATATAVPYDATVPEQTLVLTNAKARYIFTSHGGGLSSVELLNYPEQISLRYQGTTKNTDKLASLNSHVNVPVLDLLGDPQLVGDGIFTLTRTGPASVRAQKLLTNGLAIEKDFQLSSNYLVDATVRLQNTRTQTLALPEQQWVIGTAMPMDVDDNGMYVGMMWYDGSGIQDIAPSWFAGGWFSGPAKTQYLMGSSNVFWAAIHNQFFTLLAMPPTNQPARQIVGHPVSLPWLATGTSAAVPQGIQTAMVYPAVNLPAGAAIERSLILYAGPKEYRSLARMGEEMQNHADLVMNFGTGFSGFWGIGSFFAKVLLLGMNWIHDVTTLGYGWTIVLLTLILRAMFWPLMAASTRSMKKMQALGPEFKAMQEKYKDTPEKIPQKQWELYRKHKVNPMSGCLPLFIQMPVFMGFYTMIRSAIELRGAHFLWVTDLTKPDTIWIIPGLNIAFNLLPLLMVGVMVWQAHLQPPSPGMDPDQQKMMRFMPLIFLLFLYNYSSGMALYMTVSTLVAVVQTKVTKINQPAPAGPVADARLTPASKKQK